MAISKDAFTPNRGSQDQIIKTAVENGNIYFSKDTNRIFCDIDGERHTMSHDGVRFLYGHAGTEDVGVDTINEKYTIPKSKIDASPYPYYEIDMIIVNIPDSTFYRVNEITDTNVICSKILVSGSGGSGGGDDKIRLMAIPDPITKEAGFNGSYRYGADISAIFKIRDPLNLLPTINYKVEYSEKKGSPILKTGGPYQAVVGEEFTITLDGSVFQPGAGTNYVKITVMPSDGREESFLEYNNFSIFDVTFQPTSQWEDRLKSIITNTSSEFNFPYVITANMAPEEMKITREYIFDDIYPYKPEGTVNILGSNRDDLLPFILDTGFGQSGHKVRIKATMSYKGMLEGGDITLFDATYSFGYYKGADSPVIWIDNPYGDEVLNYTVIKLKYIVYDPANQTDAEVYLYSNGILARTDTFDSTEKEWAEWQIVDYEVDTLNTFTITCRDASEEVSITVRDNTAINLDPEKNGCALYLTAAGRSNKESALNRAQWKNKITNSVQGITVGDIELRNFNWATNGWINLHDYDSNDEDTQVLRVNNGAEVHIPLKAMNTANAQARTYEFDFKVRNATNYSRLVQYTAVKDPTPENPDREIISKEIVTDGTGTFLTYYGNNKGIMLGTQEAFFAIGKTSVLNVRYTDNERVKVSFAVDPNGTDVGKKYGLVYVYVNSVLTGIYDFSQDTNFENSATEIVINSNYCDVDLYNIRVYNTFLNYDQITQNWVGDATGLEEKMNRYNRNQALLDKITRKNIDFTATMQSNLIPVMVIKTYDMRNGSPKIDKLDDKLPYSKIEKRAVDVRFYNPANTKMNFHAQNVACQVQGTSSEGYPRRNFKIKLQQGDSQLATIRPFKFETWDGLDSTKDQYYDDAEHTNTDYISIKSGKGKYNLFDAVAQGNKESSFCLKADFMDSSSTHNTCLANLIQSLSVKYGVNYDVRHPLIKDFGISQTDYNYLRTTVYGFPMVIFHEDSKGNYEYVGKYNFNLDKSDTDTFGFSNNNLNPYTKRKEGKSISIPYTAKMCARLDEATADTMTSDATQNCVQYWATGTSATIKQLAEYQANITKGYVGSIPAKAQKVVKPLKWKNSKVLDPSASGKRQMDTFAESFDSGLYVWQYQIDGTWSVFKGQTAIPETGDIQPDGVALDTGITVAKLSNETPGYEDYDFVADGAAQYISSKYNIEFEVYDATSLVVNTQFYLIVTDEITYPYIYMEGVSEEAKPFSEVAECWEFTDNQAGMGKFQMPSGADESEPFYTLVSQGDGLNRFLASKSFEMRYLPSDVNILDEYTANPNDILGVNEKYKKDYINLEKVWNWTTSTDTRTATDKPLEHTVYKMSIAPSTRDKSYYLANPSVEYYVKDASQPDGYARREITRILKATYSGSSSVEPSFIDDGTLFIDFIKNQVAMQMGRDVSEIEMDDVIALYTLKKQDDTWYYNDVAIDLQTIGINLPAQYAAITMNFSIDDYYKGFQETNIILYEKFETDSVRYRLSKFKDEFENHWDKAYCLFYFVLTEFLLLYDSRQKNMMIASWGPRTQTTTADTITPGDYIWYPIFYDMDTQLGINNSGQVYWDYDIDATPLDGGDSIFSGNGSTLWDNFFICFYPEIQQMYRELRKGAFQYNTLTNYYDTNGSDKWSEIMKNIDADYKYIAPASKERGFINSNGDLDEVGNKYFYCLQGDRKLNRDSLLRNRFNYIDSEWLAYSYDPSSIGGTQVKMRYNLNDSSNTSGLNSAVRSNARFSILPYLSQYVSVIYDKNATSPIVFKLSNGQPVEPVPPTNITKQENGTVALSQQLAYIRGPEYLSSLGDLSLKYLNEFDCNPAYRLRDLRLGNETEGYYNRGLRTADLSIGGGLKDTNGGKGLINLIDLSNLNELSGSIDLSGCLKLEVFKALGTQIPSVTFANGNILKRVYLPNTIDNLTLLQSLTLTKLITDKANAKDNADDNAGLYIQDLTDKLDTPDDISIRCLINKLYISNDKMNFESYKIFNFLYQVKKNIISKSITYSDSSTMKANLLAIRLENVSWSEYIAVDSAQIYNKETITNYYKKMPNNTYVQLTGDYTASQWNAERYDNVLYYKDSSLTNPIVGLDFFDDVCVQYDDDINYPDKTNFHFRDIVDDVADPSKKVLPQITGRIHVNNDESHPVDEEQILNYYNSQKHFPKLEITANYVTECNRAIFVEYLEADENNARKVLYTQKVSKVDSTSAKITYYGDTPSRNHRDFQGWMILVDDNSVAGDYQIRESDVRKKGSVLTESEIASKKIYSTYGLMELNLSDYPNGITLVAIYSIHQYPVYFYEYDYQTVFKDKPVMINSGEYMHAPDGRPYKPINGAGTLYKCYRFIGWTNSMSGTTPLDISRIKVQSEMRMYPLFEEDSVYNNPLTIDELLYSWNTVQNGWYVGIKQDVIGKTAKICFPNTLTADGHNNGPVIGVMGKVPQDGAINTNGLFQNSNITHVFFQGMPGQDDERTCNLITIGESAFQEENNLVYVDLPTTLTSIGNLAFAFCNLSMISELPTFAGLGNNKIPMDSAFVNAAHVGPVDEWPNTLVLSGNIAYIGDRIFSQAGWSNYIIGSKQAPLTQEIYQLYVENTAAIWNDKPSGIDYYLPTKITIYASKNLDATQVKKTFELKVKNFETNYPSGNLVEVIQ